MLRSRLELRETKSSLSSVFTRARKERSMALFLPSGYNFYSADGVIAVQCFGRLVLTPGAGCKSKPHAQCRGASGPRPPSARVEQGLTCELCGYPGARTCSCYALEQDALRKNCDKQIAYIVRVSLRNFIGILNSFLPSNL